MHILFLTDNFPPEVNAPASRTYEHCREWIRQGAQVTVVTCAPNFPSGRVFDGYRNALWQSTYVDGIRVIRVWSFISSNQGFFKRILDYLSFMLSSLVASLFIRRVDVVVGTSPQFFTACAAYLVGLIKCRPWVFELRDLWPESIKAVGAMNDTFLIRLLEKVEFYLYRKADRIVAVTSSFRDSLIRRGISGGKIDVVTNGVDIEKYQPSPKDVVLNRELGLEGYFVAGYIGTHGMAHGLETLLEAAEILQKRPDAADVRFLFIGNGAEKLELVNRSQQMNLRNVLFIDSVAKTEVARYWSLLDVSVIHLRKSDLFDGVIPSKLFECMGMGIPVLHGVPGESSEIVLKAGVGEVFESGNSQALADALMRVKLDPVRRLLYSTQGPVAARTYNRNDLARCMLDIIGTLAH
ncbi:MAG: glycosyltransferase family 4 protein [Gammaproteobacteria bacterium]|nr:glycosyltransferase family 4 protein [Gammaproteobacteria bacterium]